MAEEENQELEGFDDLDGLLDEDAGGGGDGGFAGELDDFLGADDAGGDDAAAGDEGGGADSELDSFFEDLSTIDDLEVAQEETPAEVAPAPAAEAAPAPAVEAVAVAAVASVAAAPPKVRKERPWLKRAVMYLVLLGLLGGSGYYAYTTLFPSIEVPWPVVEQILEEDQPVQQQMAMQPPPKPLPFTPPPPLPLAPIAAAPPPAAPAPAASAPPAKGKGYGVQVATCFFSSCVKGFQSLLARNSRAHITTKKTTRSESLEIVSTTVFAARQTADETAQRINSEHRLEGQAFVLRSGDGFKISMGTFPDLSRASTVRDSLNQRMAGEVMFTSRLKAQTFNLRKIVTGRYATLAEARRERRALRKLDPRFRGAFIVRN